MINKKVMLIILGIVTLALVVMSLLSLMSAQGSSVGIIGGADGPTQIFVTGNPLGLYILTGIFLIAMTVWYLIYRSNNSR